MKVHVRKKPTLTNNRANIVIGKNCITMYTDFASFYDFSIEFWNCSDSVVYFVFHFDNIR